MLDQRKYESLVASSYWLIGYDVDRRRCRMVALDSEQEIGRDEHGFDADRQALVERVLVLLRLMHERNELLDLGGGDGPSERTAGQVGHDAGHAPALMLAVLVPARVDRVEARARWPGDLRVRDHRSRPS